MSGITAYGAYVPYHRLDRATIAAALGTPAGRGTRSVASFDEDTTTMGVEAARVALRSVAVSPQSLYFATADPAYLDKTNATAIHAALAFDPAVLAVDMGGAVRSGFGAVRAAMDSPAPAMAILSDLRTGLAGSGDETNGGDGAAAFVFGGDAPVIAEVVGHASTTSEFLDRWRVPGDTFSRVWEERFGEHTYVQITVDAWHDALKSAEVTAEAIDHAIVVGVHPHAARAVARSLGVRPDALADDLSSAIGNAGTAQPGLALAAVLDRAEPDQLIALVLLADGASVLLLRRDSGVAGVTGEPGCRRAARGGLERHLVRDLPHVAGHAATRTSSPARSRDPGRPAVVPARGLEVRVRGKSVRGVRPPQPAAESCVRALRSSRSHATRASCRRARHGRDVHRRPVDVHAQPAARRRRRRLRRGRALPL